MPGLKPRPAREICGILSQHGFEQVRQSGSHIVMQAHRENEFDQETTISVVVPNKSEIPVGTISSIIKHSKLPASFSNYASQLLLAPFVNSR